MGKTDLKKQFKELYTASAKEARIINVPELNYIMVDGTGNPNNSRQFKEAVQVLYGLAYTIKFMLKKQDPALDFSVMPLEGLWRADDMASFINGDKDAWKWTVMILQPDFVTDEITARAKMEAERKKGISFAGARFEVLRQGLSAQIMHLGPYAEERPTVMKLHDFIEKAGYKKRGLHHEIYLGDPRKADPAKLKTIIRQPVE
jgi:hypothetical protein